MKKNSKKTQRKYQKMVSYLVEFGRYKLTIVYMFHISLAFMYFVVSKLVRTFRPKKSNYLGNNFN